MSRMILVTIGVAVTFTAMNCGSKEPSLERDRYDAYSAFLEQCYVDDLGHGAIVLSSSTSSFSEDFPTALLQVSEEALREYEDGLDTPTELDVARISLPVPVKGVTEEEYLDLVADQLGDCDWDAFQDAFPKAEGYLRVTNVGFSEDGSEAILCGSLTTYCHHGHGGCARLVRDHSAPAKWVIECVGLYDA